MRNMDLEHKQTLTLQRLPARLTVEQTAWILGFQKHEIAILIAAKLLKPLGHPPANGTKFICAATLENLKNDEKWLARASDEVNRFWKRKNSGRKSRNSNWPAPGVTPHQS
jgi:hypothetical protein